MEIRLEIDGRKVRVREGTTVIEAANRLGIYIPHFCYHPRLSIAANCRMCLVEVARAPKPLPACATPAVDGMVVHTASAKAKRAQHGVMEFLLINHPLDCPICDQGGECELQDLAVGYGVSGSRYGEEKRVVLEKNLGPLIATDMTRCIHCTRCVRFGQEVGGVMELGLGGRGEHAEIMPFIARTVDSELSGNMIDLCPVGALTSKPFRYTARGWELTDRDGVGAHDGWGSALTVQIKNGAVMRVLPRKGDSDCWISDRDRFSYRGLSAAARLKTPLTKAKDATLWNPTAWPEALDFAAAGLRAAIKKHGAENIGFLCAPSATVEEAFLFQRLARALGSPHIDYRLRASEVAAQAGIPWFGLPIADIPVLSGALLVGANPAAELPLLADLLRRLAKRPRRKITAIGSTDISAQAPLAAQSVVAPSRLPHQLAAVLRAALGAVKAPPQKYLDLLADFEPPDDDGGGEIVQALLRGGAAIWLGAAALAHPRAAAILRLAAALAETTQARLGIFGEGANSVGVHFAGAIPRASGRSAAEMISRQMKGYVLLHAEPADFSDIAAARRAFAAAEFVVALAPFADEAKGFADAILPAAPATETDGAFVGIDGRVRTFAAAARPLGETRPGWKVLRVLAERLQLSGFDFASADEARAELFAAASLADSLDCAPLDAPTAADLAAPPAAPLIYGALERIAETPIYAVDGVVRRADALQKTHAARAAQAVFLHPDDLTAAGLRAGALAELSVDGGGVARAEAFADAAVPRGCLRAAAATAAFADLGAAATAHIRPLNLKAAGGE